MPQCPNTLIVENKLFLIFIKRSIQFQNIGEILLNLVSGSIQTNNNILAFLFHFTTQP